LHGVQAIGGIGDGQQQGIHTLRPDIEEPWWQGPAAASQGFCMVLWGVLRHVAAHLAVPWALCNAAVVGLWVLSKPPLRRAHGCKHATILGNRHGSSMASEFLSDKSTQGLLFLRSQLQTTRHHIVDERGRFRHHQPILIPR
jgi:hypothetical protein